VTLRGQTKRVLLMRVASTAVTYGQMTVHTVSADLGIMSASSSAFGLKSSGTLSWALSALRQAECSAIS
jgi:hypothetical protein